jgi:Mg-chelatase subunit ChlD
MSIPQAYLCPITLSVMNEPYSDNDGNSYEKDAIFKWIAEHGISPITRNPMQISDLRLNRALKYAIDECMGRNMAVPVELSQSVDTSVGREPVNIIMIADTSGSMQETCDVAGAAEKFNMTRLDLVKHTMKTVVESLAPTDNLALISFSGKANILSNLGSVNKITKVGLNDKIDALYADGGTNIWDALKVAVDMATNSNMEPSKKINIMLFTDGESNNDPPRGIVPTLHDYLNNALHININITLNTYGFGDNINSKLLYDISQLKNGIFGFIPDATMIGTLFINSIAYMMDNKTVCLSLMEQNTIDKFIELISNNNLPAFQNIICNEMDTTYSAFLQDLKSDCSHFDNENDGQIEKALCPQYYHKWGKNYILSVLSAYKNKMCLNFKDKGVQHFKTPEFDKYQKLIEEIFINMPPPIPSGHTCDGVSQPISSQQFSQVFYNQSSTICILENTRVRVYEDNREQYIPVQNIKKGTCILSGDSSTFVRCVIKTKYNGRICIAGQDNNNNHSSSSIIGITPYHPINITNNDWIFPINSNHFEVVNMENVYVYNFFLEDKHKIELPFGIYASTLNHGMSGPVISHEYFGTNRVENDFHSHPDWETGYICIENIKAIRDKNTNQVIKLEY